jgi:hypothetical protein
MKINQELTRSVGLEVLSVDDENRTIDFVISSEAEDSYKTIFLADKWRLERYRSNPVFTFNHFDHSNDPDDVLGTAEIIVEDGKLIARAKFEDNEEDGDRNEKADKIYRKAKKGTLRGASIRAAVYEADWGSEERDIDSDVLVFSDQELIAWSVVTVPSNPEALARSAKSIETIRTAIKDSLNDKSETEQEEKTLSRFEAQYMYNKNLNEK